jgi:hypothetical protein
MNESQGFRLNEKVIAGGLLCLLGVLFILDNMRVIDAGNLWDYWPLFLIGPGFARLLSPGPPRQRLWGAILVVGGGLLLLRNLGIFWIPFHQVWPVVLLVVGAHLIAMARSKPPTSGGGGGGVGVGGGMPGAGDRAFTGAGAGVGAPPGARASGVVEDHLDAFALFGGGNRNIQSSDFHGGNVTVIAGGFDIDLRGSTMLSDSAVVEVFVMMGGAVFRIPESWNVILNVTPVIGGTDCKARAHSPAEGPLRTLTINGFILMGGVEVKN